MLYSDNLLMVNPKKICPFCRNDKEERKKCPKCNKYGFLPIDISGLWDGSSGFLVGGGTSIDSIDYKRLSERGIVSLGINNIAGKVPVSAWVFSDPQEKFHHGLYLDPKIITFAPIPKLTKRIRVKYENEFVWDREIKDCPNTFGFDRRTELYPDKFLSTEYAMWGYGGKQPNTPFTCLATMLLGIRIMCYLGCRKIFLLGVDFVRYKDKQYAFEQKANPSNSRYIHENEMLKSIKPAIEGNGIQILNCNPLSRCDAFDFIDFDDAISDCKGKIREPFDLSGWYQLPDD